MIGIDLSLINAIIVFHENVEYGTKLTNLLKEAIFFAIECGICGEGERESTRTK
jgi:hypothetical protein